MTTVTFSEGFNFKKMKFGWLEGKLYRLPCKKDGRSYGLKKLPIIMITPKVKGFRVAREKKSFEQLRMITKSIHVEIQKCEQCR